MRDSRVPGAAFAVQQVNLEVCVALSGSGNGVKALRRERSAPKVCVQNDAGSVEDRRWPGRRGALYAIGNGLRDGGSRRRRRAVGDGIPRLGDALAHGGDNEVPEVAVAQQAGDDGSSSTLSTLGRFRKAGVVMLSY